MIEPLTARLTECPRCHQPFTCRADDIAQCDCATVTLTDAERDYIAARYTDCLCASCMKEVQAEYASQQP